MNTALIIIHVILGIIIAVGISTAILLVKTKKTIEEIREGTSTNPNSLKKKTIPNIKNWKIGEIREIDGVKVQCIFGHSCIDWIDGKHIPCYFHRKNAFCNIDCRAGGIKRKFIAISETK